MTNIQELLNNLPADQKMQVKNIVFSANPGNNNSATNFSSDKLTIYDRYRYDYSSPWVSIEMEDNFSLAQFPNLRTIAFNHNCNTQIDKLESIDISENTKLNRIIFVNRVHPLQSTGCFLIAKERQLGRVIFSYWSNIQQPIQNDELLKNQTAMPCHLIEDQKLEQLETEITQLKQQITEKDQEINNLRSQTAQTPTSAQFQELNTIALPNTQLNFDNLKQEIKRLKLKDFLPNFQREREAFNQVMDQAKNQVGEGLRTILELFLQTNQQLTEEPSEDNSFVRGQLQGQLITCQTLLQTKLTQEELNLLVAKQKEFRQLEKQLNSLQQTEYFAHTLTPPHRS